MLTASQRRFATAAYQRVEKALGTVPQQENLLARLVAKCHGREPQLLALWELAYYVGKPSRIPYHFGSLLHMMEHQVLAAAIVSEYAELLHTVLPPKTVHRLNNIELSLLN